VSLRILDMPTDRPLAPRVTSFTARFWDALADGRLLATRCSGCGRLSFPPKTHCPGCLGADVDWVELSGRGSLYSATRVHAGPARFAADIPYALGIVDLEEGVRLVTRLLGAAGPEHLDEEVALVVTRYRDGPLFAAMLARELDAAS
jgi:uncharacterized OB-fold protein